MAVKICNKCGEYNSVSSMICASCGEVLNRAEVINQEKDYIKQVKCPNCGALVNEKLAKCPECGKLIAKKMTEISYGTIEKQSSNWPMYVFSILIPLAGFIIGGIKLSKDDEDKKHIGIVCLGLGVLSIIAYTIIVYSLWI